MDDISHALASTSSPEQVIDTVIPAMVKSVKRRADFPKDQVDLGGMITSVIQITAKCIQQYDLGEVQMENLELQLSLSLTVELARVAFASNQSISADAERKNMKLAALVNRMRRGGIQVVDPEIVAKMTGTSADRWKI